MVARQSSNRAPTHDIDSRPIGSEADDIILERALLALSRQGLVGTVDLASLSDVELLQLRGVGPRGLELLRRYLQTETLPVGRESGAGTLAEAVHRALDHLPGRERVVIERLYGLDGRDPEPASVLGRRLDRSPGRIRALRDQALQRLAYPLPWAILAPWAAALLPGAGMPPTDFGHVDGPAGSREEGPEQMLMADVVRLFRTRK